MEVAGRQPQIAIPLTVCDLPLGVQATILCFLTDSADVIAAACTCKAWRTLVDAHVFPNATRFRLARRSASLPDRLPWILHKFPNVEHLDASGFTGAWSATLLSQLLHWRLKALDMSGPSTFSDLSTLAEHLSPALTAMNLSNTAASLMTSSPAMAQVLQQLPALQDLNLSCQGLRRPGERGPGRGGQQQDWLATASMYCLQLTRLCCDGQALNSQSPYFLAAFLRFQNLRWVSLAGCVNVGPVGPALGHCTLLEHLDLSGTSITHHDLIRVATSCPLLSCLRVANCHSLDMGPASHVAGTLGKCPAVQHGRLRELDFSGLPNMYLQPLLCDMSRALPLAGPGHRTLILRLSGTSVRDSDLLPLVCCPRRTDPGSPTLPSSSNAAATDLLAPTDQHVVTGCTNVPPSTSTSSDTWGPAAVPPSASMSSVTRGHTAVPPFTSTSSVTWSPVTVPPSTSTSAVTRVPGNRSHPDCCWLVSEHLAAEVDRKSGPAGVRVETESNREPDGEGPTGDRNAQTMAGEVRQNGITSGKCYGRGGKPAEDTLVSRYGAVLYTPGGAGDVYWRTPREWGGALRLGELSLRECNGVTERFLRELGACPAVLQGLTRLDLGNMRALQERADGAPACERALVAIARAAGSSLKVLELDGALLTDDGLTGVLVACPAVESLSLIGCKGFGNAGLKAAAEALPCLRRLAVGGSNFLWTEADGLAAFSGLEELSVSRRPVTDSALAGVLKRQPALRVLELAGCHVITDEALRACPAGLRTLSLVLCESVAGKVLPRFRQLSRLRVVKCRKVSLQAIQAAAAACTRLQVLTVDRHVAPHQCLPVALQEHSHVRGIVVQHWV